MSNMYSNGSIVSSCPIPSRVVPSENWTQTPESLGQTPGGTLFSTTPGGTRIVYDRKFLLGCRNSPLARTPPSCLPQIPGVTMPTVHPMGKLEELDESSKDLPGEMGILSHPTASADDSQFVMDM
ncbi:eukaryotic translation initiation factor 4E-binding protein 3-like isoform X1 [Clupea harengus]|uniref:Eukaryotic translation initiation factor 4E-binding protein 3-like isoform X1 n=1 Tax=Clupea harengus TaxID=7950 RepID=A0A6P3W6M8_CLUHA|nr:eukaryotic translation initiation factor 4E-binding protein 3-like isoform X1 [Clupea harengus]